MIGNGLSWNDAQFYLQKYKEQIRVIDIQLAKAQLGEDAESDLKAKKARTAVEVSSPSTR